MKNSAKGASAGGPDQDKWCGMHSWEVLREAIDRVGVKVIAAKLNLSTALVYKWCQEPGRDGPGGSGAHNPLDRALEIFELTKDERLINWLCHASGGFFVPNPHIPPGAEEASLLGTTQRFVETFGELLRTVSRSVENDGHINPEEAGHIRQSWEALKFKAEQFVVACERGLYGKK